MVKVSVPRPHSIYKDRITIKDKTTSNEILPEMKQHTRKHICTFQQVTARARSIETRGSEKNKIAKRESFLRDDF